MKSLKNAHLKSHPIAGLFPLMDDAGLKILTDDIKKNGLVQPITIYEQLVLDGRARLRACKAESVPLKFVEWTGGTSPVEFVISQNLSRRHLTPSQRAAIAVEALPMFEREAKERQKLSRGRGRKGTASVRDLKCGTAASHAAGVFHVSSRLIEDLKAVKKRAPEEFAAIKLGEKTTADGKRALQRLDYEQRVREANANPDPASVGGLCDLIYADPPWPLPGGTSSRSIENHYKTLAIDKICELNVPAKANSLLVLWAVASMLAEALQVMQAWNFTYITHCVWNKEIAGLGCWFRNQHELLLLGKRGKFPPPIPSELIPSIFSERRREHSRKPDYIYEWIDRAFVGKSKCEMFARQRRPGWKIWGNECSPDLER